VQAIGAVLGGTQSLHTNSFDEAIALPTEKAARLALRTQQVLAHETDLTATVDPFAGSYAVEALTDEVEAQVVALMDRVEELGGAVPAIEQGFQKQEIERAAYEVAQQIDAGERVVVGVNRFRVDEEEPYEPLRVDPAIEEAQAARLATLRRQRDAAAVHLGWGSALLAGAVTFYVDMILGALTGHTWQVFGALWLYAMAVGGAVTGVAAAFGTVASMALTAFLVVVGNAAAAGPVGRPLLSGFYSTFTTIVPQGSGVSLLRSVMYFGGNGAMTALVTLAIWGAAGCLLAIGATASRLNYRALYQHYAGRGRCVLRPRVLSPAD
jgi:hypothetical protein